MAHQYLVNKVRVDYSLEGRLDCIILFTELKKENLCQRNQDPKRVFLSCQKITTVFSLKLIQSGRASLKLPESFYICFIQLLNLRM